EGRGGSPVIALIARSLAVLAGLAIAARIFQPYAFLGPSPLSFRLDPRWVGDLKRLTGLSTSVAGYPPNFQWAGRTPLFPVKNVVLWGMGPFFGIAAIAALIWFAATLWRRRQWPLLPLLLHVLFLFAYHGFTMVKSIRYIYPAYAAMAVLAALLLADLARRKGAGRMRRALPAVALPGTFLCAVALTSI